MLFRTFLYYFLVYIFCGQVWLGFYVLVFIFNTVNYVLILVGLFAIYCFCSLKIGNLLRSYEYLLLTSRLPDFSRVVFFLFVLIVGCVLFSWLCYELVVQVGLNSLVFYLEIRFSLILVPAYFSKYIEIFFEVFVEWFLRQLERRYSESMF